MSLTEACLGRGGGVREASGPGRAACGEATLQVRAGRGQGNILPAPPIGPPLLLELPIGRQ